MCLTVDACAMMPNTNKANVHNVHYFISNLLTVTQGRKSKSLSYVFLDVCCNCILSRRVNAA